jgi:predicted permease
MRRLLKWWKLSRVRALLARRTVDAEMEEEMRFHLEMRIQANQAAGMAEEAARHAARRRFGHADGIKETCRDERGWPWLEQTLKDIRLALRGLARTPGRSGVAVFTLALGMGLATVQVSFVRAAFRGLPFERSDRIMQLFLAQDKGIPWPALAPEDYLAWQKAQKSFSETGAYDEDSGVDLSGDGFFARHYPGVALSAGMLRVLRVAPQLGRGFGPEDERAGAEKVVLLSHGAWQRDFGGDRQVIGRRMHSRGDDPAKIVQGTGVRGETVTIIGVMPEGFAFGDRAQCWYNLRAEAGPKARRVEVIGRLRDGVTLAQARAEAAVVGRSPSPGGKPRRLFVGPLMDLQTVSSIRVLLFTLLGIAGGVLALACANVATLLFLRATERSRELALRLALGAGRARIIGQALCESSLLAGLGAAAGVLLAWWGTALLNRQLSADFAVPFWLIVRLDGAVLAAVILMVLLVSLGIGLVPALRAARLDANATLKSAPDSAGGLRLGLVTRGLVLVETASACAVLLVTGILVDGVRQFGRDALPFDPDRTLSAHLYAGPYIKDPKAVDAFFAAVVDRAGALPGVEGATLSMQHPMENANRTLIEPRGGAPQIEAHYQAVAANFFPAMATPVRQGRGFNHADREGGEPVAVINESLARRAWPGESPLGRQFRAEELAPEWITVIGVCADLPMQGALGTGSPAGFYRPMAQLSMWGATLLLRSRGDPHPLAQPLRQIVRNLDPELPVDQIYTVAEWRDRRLATARGFAWLAAVFAAGALFLGGVGIYGVTAFGAARRKREFGIRLALGARPGDLAAMVVRRALTQIGLSLGAGLLLGWLLSRPMVASMGHMIGPTRVGTYLVVAGVLAAAVSIALWLPARRALRVDPAVTLRGE